MTLFKFGEAFLMDYFWLESKLRLQGYKQMHKKH